MAVTTPYAVNTIFQIPALAPTIPAQILPGGSRKKGARLARCLLDAGVIRGRVSTARAAEPVATCQTYLQAWLRERLGTLRCLAPVFRLDLGQRDPHAGDASADAADGYVVWFSYVRPFAVGAALDRLEQIRPGLGATVLGTIEEKAWGLVPVFTPREAQSTAEEFYWYGESDESVALDEQAGDDEAEREALREQMVTKEKIDSAYPQWALKRPKRRKRVSQRELKRIAATARSALVRQVADATLALSSIKLDGRFRPDEDGWFVGFGAVVTWQQGDITVRIFDDYVNYAYEGDAYDTIGAHELSFDGPTCTLDWMAAMEVRFEGMRQLDRLIHALSTGDWLHTSKGWCR